MTAVILLAEALLAASIMTRSCIRLRLTGWPRDCTINTSAPARSRGSGRTLTGGELPQLHATELYVQPVGYPVGEIGVALP